MAGVVDRLRFEAKTKSKSMPGRGHPLRDVKGRMRRVKKQRGSAKGREELKSELIARKQGWTVLRLQGNMMENRMI